MPFWPSIPAMLGGAAEQFADRVAVRDGETTLSYAELDQAAGEFGAALVAAGVEPGDRVAIWCGNCVEWTVAALGLFAAGAVLVPVNTRFKGAEAADDPGPERGPRARDRHRLPGHRLRGHAGENRHPAARAPDDRRGQGRCDGTRGVVA